MATVSAKDKPGISMAGCSDLVQPLTEQKSP